MRAQEGERIGELGGGRSADVRMVQREGELVLAGPQDERVGGLAGAAVVDDLERRVTLLDRRCEVVDVAGVERGRRLALSFQGVELGLLEAEGERVAERQVAALRAASPFAGVGAGGSCG